MAALEAECLFGICLFLVLTAQIIAKDDLTLEVKEFNSSMIDFVCQYKGNKTGVSFKVLRDEYKCIECRQNCTFQNLHNEEICKMQCKESKEPKTVVFIINLDERCQLDEMSIRCSVKKLAEELDLTESIHLTAPPSDPPILSIEQPLFVDSRPVRIVCTVTNTCTQTELEISGDVNMTPLHMSYIQQGSRYNTTAQTTAIFDKKGNYTIKCKEEGRSDFFSTNLTFLVQEKIEDKQESGASKESTSAGQLIALWVIIAVVGTFVLCGSAVIFFILRKRRRQKMKRKKRSHSNNNDEEQYPLQDQALNQTDRSHSNNNDEEQRPLQDQAPNQSDSSSPSGTICGIWIKEDEKIAKKLSDCIKSQKYGMKVYGPRMDDISFLQEFSSYLGYYAVISSNSLENRTFLLYVTTVLRCLTSCNNAHRQPTLVLIGANDDLHLLRQKITLLSDQQGLLSSHQNAHPLIYLQTIPKVNSVLQLHDKHLHLFASRLRAPPLREEISNSVGRIGIGLAWSSFYKRYACIFPGMQPRIEKSGKLDKYGRRMSKHYIVVIPDSNEISEELKNGHSGLTDIEELDKGIKITPAWSRPSNTTELIYKVTNSKGDHYYCCLIYISHPSSLKMESSFDRKQFSLYMNTTESILQHPYCGDGVLVFNCMNVSRLADDLFDLIQKHQHQEPSMFPIDPISQVTAVAEGLAWSYYQRRITKMGLKIAKKIQSSRYYHNKQLPTKFFILLPYSCTCYPNLNNDDGENTEDAGIVKMSDLDHKIPIYQISDGREKYFACAEYCPEVQVLQDMNDKWHIDLTPMQKAAELRVLNETLHDLLTQPDYCSNFKVVYYDDSQNSGKKLSELMLQVIKQSLQEENSPTSM